MDVCTKMPATYFIQAILSDLTYIFFFIDLQYIGVQHMGNVPGRFVVYLTEAWSVLNFIELTLFLLMTYHQCKV